MRPFHFYFVVFTKYGTSLEILFSRYFGVKNDLFHSKIILGGLKLTSDNVIRITKVAKSLKIKVLEDICLNYITKSIEPVKNELFKVAPKKSSDEGRS